MRSRVYLENGEDIDGVGGMRCPGEGKCERWDGAAGETFEEKVHCCEGCPNECRPPVETSERGGEGESEREDEDAAEIDRLVEQIAYLVSWENARPGETDWGEYDFDTQKLYVIWRNHEADIRLIRELRHQEFIKTQMSIFQAQFKPK